MTPHRFLALWLLAFSALPAPTVRYRLGLTHADLASRSEPDTAALHRVGVEFEVGW